MTSAGRHDQVVVVPVRTLAQRDLPAGWIDTGQRIADEFQIQVGGDSRKWIAMLAPLVKR